MPYRIEKTTGRRPWKIIREDTGAAVGFAETKAKAQASVRARMAAETRARGAKRKPKRRWSWL